MDNLFLVTVIFSELVLGLSSSLPQSTESLDGYAFDCSGVLIGFSGKTNIHCMNSVNNNNNDYLCGEYQWDGKEYRLTVQASEVVICHYALLQEGSPHMELDPEQDLELDQSQLYAECGLEDLLHLVQQWQQFLPA